MRRKGSIHSRIVNQLFNRIQQKPYGKISGKNLEYNHGELDVYYETEDRLVYIEVKSNHSQKTYQKAKRQKERFMGMYPTHKEKRFVYYTPQTGPRLI